MSQKSRPLSPHLANYKFQITMAMSIFQRATGIGMYFGLALVVWWLAAAATSNNALGLVYTIMDNWFGMLILFGMTWALFQHLVGGFRFLAADLGFGLERNARFGFAWFNLIAGLVLTFLVWLVFVWL